MSDLTGKFSALQAELSILSETTNSYIDTTEAKLQAIFDQLDLMLINNAANTKAMIQALGQTGACFPCPTPPFTVPPISTTPTSITTGSCKRSHGIVATLHNILAQMDTMQTFNVIGTFNVINDAIGEIIAAIVAGDTVPLPTFPEVVNIVGNYISYAGERLFSGVGLVEQFAPLEASITSAIWLASDPSVAATQYANVIDASEASPVAKLLFVSIAYNALWSYYYDTESTPDVDGYSGTDCALFDCEVFASVATSIGGGANVQIVEWTPAYLPVNNHDGATSNKMTWATLDMVGFQLTPNRAVKVFVSSIDSGSVINAGTTYTIPTSTTYVAIVEHDPGAFTVQVCPPD